MLTVTEQKELDRLNKESVAFSNFKVRHLRHKNDRISPEFFKSYQRILDEKTKLEVKATIFRDECSHVDTEDLENDENLLLCKK